MVFACGKRAWYMYGASNNEERNRMPAYLLQWEAMRWAAGKGCTEYICGAFQTAARKSLSRVYAVDSGLWGVYRFKAGLRASIALGWRV